MATPSRNPWRLSSMLAAACEVAVALLLLLQMAFAFIVLQLMKRFTPVRICSNHTIGHHHALFRFGPFSLLGDFASNLPIRKKLDLSHGEASTSKQGRDLFPVRNSNNLLHPCLKGKQEPGRSSSNSSLSSGKGSDLGEFRTYDMISGISSHRVSTGTSLVYRRKGRVGNKEGHSMLLGDTGSWSEEGVYEDNDEEEASSIAILNQHTTFTWMHQLHKGEASNGSLLDYREDSEHSVCQQGHCCETVLRMTKTLEIARQHLRNIYMELEEERDAAETAANEAMAMILRLQEEKSGLLLETDHYQRMAEEKAFHDERAIQDLEEDLCKKENECLLLEEELNELKQNTMRTRQQDKTIENASFANIGKQSSHCGEHEVSYLKEEKAMGNASLHKRWNLAVMTQDNPTITEPNKRTSYNMDESSVGYSTGDEKVVNIDVTNMNYKASWEAEIPLSPQDIFEVHEEKKARIKSLQQSEAKEEEKYVDIPSNVEEAYETSLIKSPMSSLSDTSSQVYEEGNCKSKLVTLEDIDSRLRILENKTLLSMQKSLSSNDQHMNMILLKEILQELQMLLHANQT